MGGPWPAAAVPWEWVGCVGSGVGGEGMETVWTARSLPVTQKGGEAVPQAAGAAGQAEGSPGGWGRRGRLLSG